MEPLTLKRKREGFVIVQFSLVYYSDMFFTTFIQVTFVSSQHMISRPKPNRASAINRVGGNHSKVLDSA